ncbi:MAG: protein jag [Clostridia bacterium]|nr:protein jag [Clostridia bacterium]
MKKELIVTAKTVEEARKKAAAELNVDEEALSVTVLDEGKKGFLGIGAADAKISVTYTVKGEDCAMEFIKTVIADMGLEGLEIGKKAGDNGDVIITVDGDSAGVLIGHHGETLDALQYLANLAANKKVNGEKREYAKITLDIENYRAKRETALRALARRMAAKVVKYKKSVMLEPMNPYERRIIHSEVQSIEGVSTNSIGSENNRRVVMFLDDSKAEKDN